MAFIAGEPNLICLTIYVLHISGRIFVLCVSIMYNGRNYMQGWNSERPTVDRYTADARTTRRTPSAARLDI